MASTIEENQIFPSSEQSLYEVLRNDLLPQVQKPGQYLGNEFGAAKKDWTQAKSRMALIYPDLYELGMSNFGIKILYSIVNQNPDYLCDRAFAPMQDMEALLEERSMPLWGWESYQPLNQFDMLGFSLGYELVYTNILTMLHLCHIPFMSAERSMQDPFIFAGGPAVFNPEVMADYFDFYLIGDGEETIIEVQDSMLKSKQEYFSAPSLELDEVNKMRAKEAELSSEESRKLREQILLDLAQIKGVYVPRFYSPDQQENGMAKANRDDVPAKVEKRVVDLTELNQPTIGPVPNINVVQDKQSMELRRGCDRGCRFCQPGYVYLPVRERSPEELADLSYKAIKNTGYEDYSLLSLSASDYTCLTEAARAMNDIHAENGVSLSMPSQRADRFNVELAAEIQQVRKSGVTLAPEAGTERMRKIINKGLKEEEIRRAIKNVYQEGWTHVKLYFMIGLPFEEDSDLDGILDILSWAVNMSKEVRRSDREKYRKQLQITCTISTFVPKSFTPFQWFPQCSTEEFTRKEKYLLDALRQRNIHRHVKLNCTSPDLAMIESVLSRGGREWGNVVKDIWDNGARMDSWEENFNVERWQNAAKKFGLDLEKESTKDRAIGSKQPWNVLDIGLLDKFLVQEWEKASQEAETAPCTENKCHACGVCFELGVKNVVSKDVSDKNPFVTEIDKEKRKASCASLLNELEENTWFTENYKSAKESGQINNIEREEREVPISAGGQKIVIKHYETKQKLRLQYSKTGDLKFIGHLDFQRLMERALRRAQFPIVHTTGFNQRMKLHWGPALPLFLESKWEYFELELAENFEDLQNFKDILNNQLPKQARIISVEEISTTGKSSINKVLTADYCVTLIDEEKSRDQNSKTSISQEEIDKFLAQKIIEITKTVKGKVKQKDIRDSILKIDLESPSVLKLKLKSTQKAEEVINSLKPEAKCQIVKEHQEIG